ncbi:MAG: nucleotidyltransferase domain-containing protein [Clostridiales Family XIII bacterium]|jgi:predicted nucleotidyltransferase|nr:nucleotidyltransferase domain-containing protein [Clostridiales Family XIII bacterium]
MAFDIGALNETIRSYVADVKNAMPIDRTFLFGSHAKGTATEQSDIDVCFFSRNFENRPTIDIMTQLFRLTRKYKGVDIEPLGFPTSELENDNPFVKEILRTGREI